MYADQDAKSVSTVTSVVFWGSDGGSFTVPRTKAHSLFSLSSTHSHALAIPAIAGETSTSCGLLMMSFSAGICLNSAVAGFLVHTFVAD